jgi:hypothetical protein
MPLGETVFDFLTNKDGLHILDQVSDFRQHIEYLVFQLLACQNKHAYVILMFSCCIPYTHVDILAWQ